jgi:hypothetical protein
MFHRFSSACYPSVTPVNPTDAFSVVLKEAARQLQEAGIVDSQGRRIRKDLPTDMREGEDRDFGG